MNKLILATTVSLLCFAPIGWAADEHHPPGAPATDAKSMRMMQEHMLKMHAQMHKIMEAKDPAERERLMQEHQKMMQDVMHDHMMQMHGGMGGGMGPGMGGDGKMGKPNPPAGK
jgi:hypothetical protein